MPWQNPQVTDQATPQIGFFPYHGGDIEILIRVANYDYTDSGIPGPLFLANKQPC